MSIRDRTAAALAPFFFLLLAVHGLGSAVDSWDLAVTVGNKIDFILRNGNATNKTIITNASHLVGMAYDDDSSTLFLSDAKNRNFSIFSVNLSESNITFTPILKKGASEPVVLSLAFDSRTRTLYWTNEKAIMKMYLPLNDVPSKPVLVHKLDTEIPRGIALDVCNRHIYWGNSNRSKPSIMRSNFNGTEPMPIITRNLYEPSSIVVDHINSKIYWIDDEEGIHYKLEQSNLDGSERIILVQGQNQEPMYLAIDSQSLYWTDFVYNAVWEIDKDARLGVQPNNFKSYFDPSRQDNLRSIVTKENAGSAIDCKAMAENDASKKRVTSAIHLSKSRSFINLTTNEQEKCSNKGELETSSQTCLCKSGYSGSRCEISSCHNYCLTGDCFVNDEGMPVCKCSTSYSGLRCEHDICNGYCLNNGRCFVDNEKPSCECKYFSGVRCEVAFDIAEICAIYCINRQLQITNIDITSCRCTELNQTIEEVLGYDTFNCTIMISLLSGFIGMLTIIVVLLSIYASKLRRRPRIKKRFVVNKTGITPLTSRPSQMSADQCEITIENCCNMNICETPCFEPKLRPSNAINSSVKIEEKSGLLDHMDGGGLSC